jgi:branched-subunit amino acid aminotransferase/4-amino-4-deoxychorismate lyase
MEIVKELGMTMEERRVSLAEFHSADEVCCCCGVFWC